MADAPRIAPLFSGWEDTLILSFLQGHMGYAVADDDERPSSAQIVAGDFCFFAGIPDRGLAAGAAAPIMVPRDAEWAGLLEAVWENRAEKTLRYAIKKEPDAFSVQKLAAYADSLPEGYVLRKIGREIYDRVMGEEWSRDFCSQFADYDDYRQRGLGIVALYRGEPVSGASSYAVYDGGMEIEIDTKPEYRRKGLGRVWKIIHPSLTPQFRAKNRVIFRCRDTTASKTPDF